MKKGLSSSAVPVHGVELTADGGAGHDELRCLDLARAYN